MNTGLVTQRRYSNDTFTQAISACIGTGLLFSYISFGPLPYLVSSLIILFLCGLSALRFGAISAQTIIFVCVYVPALAFLWAQLNGADYINSHNHWLQDKINYVDSAVHLTLASALISSSIMSAKEKTYTKTLSLTNTRNGFSIPIHITIIITAGFFFWLTEPVFATILTHPYEYILKNRIENTQFAGSVAVILWLIALSNHLKFSNLELNKDPVKLARTLFLLITILALLWLALHARRSELIGMGLVGLLVLREKSSTLHLSFLIGLLLAALIIAEEIRTATLVGVIFNDATSQSSGGSNIASLPGGASNIYMTFANTLHYFDDNDFLLGTTFKNYVLQILPTPLYQSIGISKPNYFYEKIFHNYSYNGGTYIGALFYGNFGVLGMMLFGAFIGIYSRITVKLMYSTHIIIKATGFFLIVLVFRGFWYEFIIILKPLIIVFIPGFLIYESIQSSKLG